MKKSLLLLILCIVRYSASSQTAEDVRNYFSLKNFDSVIVCGKAVIEQKKDEYDTYMLVGRAYNARLMYAQAIPYLEKAKELSDVPNWVTAWSLCEAGLAYYATGDKKKSAENLYGCIKLNATKNSQSMALRYTWIFGLDNFFDSWTTKESKHFIFHFQDASQLKTESYLQSHENAIDSLCRLFKCTFSRKLDFYVWKNDSDEVARTHLRPLAFTRPEYSVTHTSPSHSLAHEIMHHILNAAFPNAKPNELIVEGTCVYFDLSQRDNMKKLLERKDKTPINIKSYWSPVSKMDESIYYPLGGELVKRLYTKFGKDTFFSFLADQSYANASRVFGKELEPLIDEFENELNR